MKTNLARFWKNHPLWFWIPIILLGVICFAIFLFSPFFGGAMRMASRSSDVSVSSGAQSSSLFPEALDRRSIGNTIDSIISAGFDRNNDVPLEQHLASAVAQAQDTQVIIYTGEISLVVRDIREAIDNITQITTEQGGFVSGSEVFETGDALRGNIIIRVPAERYQDTLTQLREMSLRVEREVTRSDDVTQQFTDLQARKTNLEVAEAALQELLAERQRIGSTSDILEVHREMTNIRGQIEQIEGLLRYLANQAALSTITIQLTPDILYQPISVAGWEPQGVAREAVQSLVAALQGLANIVIWFVIFLLPLLIVLAIPVVLVIWLIRKWRHRRSRGQAVAEA